MTPPTPYQDYIPASDSDFEVWNTAFAARYAATLLTPPIGVDVGQAASVYAAALADSTNGGTRGPMTIQAKNDARAAAESISRLAAQAMVAAYNNGVLTGEQLTEAGVRIPSTLNTPRLPPISGPDLGLRCITPGQLSLTVFDPLTSTFKKPIGVVGAEIWRGVWSGDPLVAPTSFDYVELATRKVVQCATTGDTGTKCRYKARWITVRGETSPYGAELDAWAS